MSGFLNSALNIYSRNQVTKCTLFDNYVVLTKLLQLLKLFDS